MHGEDTHLGVIERADWQFELLAESSSQIAPQRTSALRIVVRVFKHSVSSGAQ